MFGVVGNVRAEAPRPSIRWSRRSDSKRRPAVYETGWGSNVREYPSAVRAGNKFRKEHEMRSSAPQARQPNTHLPALAFPFVVFGSNRYSFRAIDTHLPAVGYATWNCSLTASVGCRSEEHTSELQSHHDLVCRLLLEKKKNKD